MQTDFDARNWRDVAEEAQQLAEQYRRERDEAVTAKGHLVELLDELRAERDNFKSQLAQSGFQIICPKCNGVWEIPKSIRRDRQFYCPDCYIERMKNASR